ncbi:hypothetical protein QQF64_036440 [Cirrhinus molitorella]|uniref:Uncharacterized protein n=1 Tax=Cirrhinus molitorella TaxID=172907 RepID=A0ABR3NIZ1_9TELE
MELYLQKSSCPEAEKADTVLSHLLGRAKNIIKVGLKSTASTGSASAEKIYDMLRHYLSDHPVSLLPLADFYATQPKAKESPVDYWVRLNSAAERANSHLGRSGSNLENMSAEVAMMFIRNCPDPELSSMFKCKPMSRWSIEEIQEAIDEHQRESQCRRIPSAVKPRTFQVLTTKMVPSSEEALEGEITAINTAACTPSSHSEAAKTFPSNSDALERVLSMLERVLEQTSQPANSSFRSFQTQRASHLAVFVEIHHACAWKRACSHWRGDDVSRMSDTLSDKDDFLLYEESCKAIPDKCVLYQNVMKLERADSLFYTDEVIFRALLNSGSMACTINEEAES